MCCYENGSKIQWAALRLITCFLLKWEMTPCLSESRRIFIYDLPIFIVCCLSFLLFNRFLGAQQYAVISNSRFFFIFIGDSLCKMFINISTHGATSVIFFSNFVFTESISDRHRSRVNSKFWHLAKFTIVCTKFRIMCIQFIMRPNDPLRWLIGRIDRYNG